MIGSLIAVYVIFSLGYQAGAAGFRFRDVITVSPTAEKPLLDL